MARRPRLSRKILWIAIAAAAIAVMAWRALAPSSLVVATAEAARGPLVVTVDEDGRTRAVDRRHGVRPGTDRQVLCLNSTSSRDDQRSLDNIA